MSRLASIDLAVVALYCFAVLVLGSFFFRKSRTVAGFTAASGSLPSWAIGFSIFATYLSSNTFLGYPGRAFASNWNVFVFSLALPIAAWIATRYFVPFYRQSGEISAYSHLERRFGGWARTYAMICYLLTQLARIGAILFGVALALGPLTGLDPKTLILATGVLVTLYTLLGGIEAVIWTDVVQSVLLTGGAIVTVLFLLWGMPEGPGQLFAIAWEQGKFSLGSARLDLSDSTIWVVLLYGLFINLNNFGIDQSYVQRYHTAGSSSEASRSLWLAAALYLPISLLFLFIGSGLFAFYHSQPELRAELGESIVAARGASVTATAGLTDADLGDRAFPHFITHRLPVGLSGLVLAALFAAAMSSIDTSLNSSATVLWSDLYCRWAKHKPSERESMRVLYAGTILVGALGTMTAVLMIGVQSLLEAWWTLSGIFAGGMLGLFLLGMMARRADRAAGLTGVLLGILVIAWMTLSPQLPEGSPLRSPFHSNMIIVFGTMTIFFVGLWASRRRVGMQRENP